MTLHDLALILIGCGIGGTVCTFTAFAGGYRYRQDEEARARR